MNAKLQLSRMHYPVTVLGYGTRIGIWFQGCSIGCQGCISRDTWDPGAGVEVSVEHVLARCEEWRRSGKVDGITISGGEPFDQPAGLLDLLEGFEQWLDADRSSVDLLCYSGYSARRLRIRHPEILERLDALIPSPFVAGRAPGGRWRGSSNQPISALSAIGQTRYGDVSSAPPQVPEIQFVVDDGIWFIGIPRPGDMDAVEEKLRQRGVVLEAMSWR